MAHPDSNYTLNNYLVSIIMQKKPLFKPVFLFVILGIICLIFVIRNNTNNNNIDPFSIQLKSAQKTNVILRQYLKNKPTLLVFWASWCGHCQQEVAVINQFYTKHPEFDIIGIQVDNGIANEIFKQVKYPNLDGAANGLLIMQQFGNDGGGIPYIVFVNKQGKAVDENIGEISLDKLEKMTSTLK